MPEAGLIPIPKKLARQGVKDMVRISDGRMSGTAAGTIGAARDAGGRARWPLALVQTGDRIRLSVARRSLQLRVDEQELARRRQALPPASPREEDERGYRSLFLRTVMQADAGCDFDFLRATKTVATVPEPVVRPSR